MSQTLRVLLTEIIDYAGLFPPSQVSMAVAVRNFAAYLKGDPNWMLGRFIVPVDRLDEFSETAKKQLNGKKLWRLSVLASDDLPKTLEKVSRFNNQYQDQANIDTLEIKVAEAGEITEAAKILPSNVTAYFEIPPNDTLADFITALALTRQRAKIRTGGVTTDAFPSTDAIIKFMRICIAANVPFKATAGLHHPLRCNKPLTYEVNSPTGIMHGFLNLFLSACFLRQNLKDLSVHRLMNEIEAAAFQFNEDHIQWGDHIIPRQIIELTRRRNAISFGSCSFLEPIEDLQSLGLL